MNIKSFGLFISVGVLNICLSAPYAFSDTPQKNAVPQAKVAPKMSLYIQEKGKDDKLDRELIPCDFGDLDFLDTNIRNEQIDHRSNMNEAADEYVTGVKKYFYLVNDGNVNLKINASTYDPFSVGLYRVVGKRFLPLDYDYYTLKPNEKLELLLAFDYTSATPGKFEQIIELGDPQDNCYATFMVRANLKSGIEFSPQHLDFGSIPSGTKSSLNFNLKLDRRMPHFTMQPFQFVTANKYLRITSIPANLKLKGVNVSNDNIEFKAGGKPLDKDLDLKFRVELLDSAPLGKINEQVKLAIVGSPGFLLLGDAKLHVTGEVTGHMRSAPSSSINFGTLPIKKSARKVATISCTAPLTLSSLRVVSSNRFVTVHLILPAGDASNVAKLQMTLSPNVPVGKLIGKVTVTNTVNKERIEFLTGATITK